VDLLAAGAVAASADKVRPLQLALALARRNGFRSVIIAPPDLKGFEGERVIQHARTGAQ
jgi:hypothetical protein